MRDCKPHTLDPIFYHLSSCYYDINMLFRHNNSQSSSVNDERDHDSTESRSVRLIFLTEKESSTTWYRIHIDHAHLISPSDHCPDHHKTHRGFARSTFRPPELLTISSIASTSISLSSPLEWTTGQTPTTVNEGWSISSSVSHNGVTLSSSIIIDRSWFINHHDQHSDHCTIHRRSVQWNFHSQKLFS